MVEQEEGLSNCMCVFLFPTNGAARWLHPSPKLSSTFIFLIKKILQLTWFISLSVLQMAEVGHAQDCSLNVTLLLETI